MNRDFTIRVDAVDPGFRHIHLILAKGFPGGDDLPVQIGQGNPVMVDQIQRADPCAGQRFHDIAAYAANAENGDPALLKLFHRFRTEEHLCPGKGRFHLKTLQRSDWDIRNYTMKRKQLKRFLLSPELFCFQSVLQNETAVRTRSNPDDSGENRDKKRGGNEHDEKNDGRSVDSDSDPVQPGRAGRTDLAEGRYRRTGHGDPGPSSGARLPGGGSDRHL